MLWSRRMYLRLLVAVLIAGPLAACASADIGMLPPHIQRNALRDSILAKADTMTFDPFQGDQQVVADPWLPFVGKTYGVIEPQANSHTDPIFHQKVIARIKVTKNYRGLKKDVWNYFVVVDVSAGGTGEWGTAFVSARNPLVLRRLTTRQEPSGHPRAKAQWQNQSSAVPWATCAGTLCCCEGTKCNDLIY